MRVLVNALPARDGGGLTYLIEEMRSIESVEPNVQMEVLVSPWSHKFVAQSIRSPVRCVSVKTVAQRFGYEETVMRLQARKSDLLYCPLNFGPVLFGGRRSILTLHNPNYFGGGLKVAGAESARPWVKVKACHAAIRECKTVVVISDSFRDQVLATLPESEPKLRVVKSGRPEWESVESIPPEAVPSRFVLTVGSAAPHKRLDEVVEGWSRAVTTTEEQVALVIVGGLSDIARRQHIDVAGPNSGLLVHLGRVTERGQLRWLYEHALAALSMSVLESFGLTIVEAGALGCPLILSDIPAHREVSLGNAIFVPVGGTDSLATALIRGFSGKPRSAQWTWPVTWSDHARSLVSLFESALR